jgi:hypothetical protein
MNLASFLLPLAVVGWGVLPRRIGRWPAVAFGAITAIHVLFFIRYPVPDQFTFILPSLLLIALAAGVGLGWLMDRSVRWRRLAVGAGIVSILLPPLVYGLSLPLARAVVKGPVRSHQLPYRDELRYWLWPWKQDEHSARRFAQAAFEQAAPDGVIVPDSTSRYPLNVWQALTGQAPGVAVQDKQGPLPVYREGSLLYAGILGDRELFVVTPPRSRAFLPDDGELVRPPGEPLYRFIGR